MHKVTMRYSRLQHARGYSKERDTQATKRSHDGCGRDCSPCYVERIIKYTQAGMTTASLNMHYI